jgi:hypothetical protein
MLFTLLFALLSFGFTGCHNPTNDGEVFTDAASLAGTVWGGETPRSGDWLTIAFNYYSGDAENGYSVDAEAGALKTLWSFSFDNSTNVWDYTFDNGEGAISTGGPWNPCPSGFTISGDTLTVTNYGNHSGGPRTFTRLR